MLRRLENNYRFDYDFYIWPSEYIVHEINDLDYDTTRVQVKLDSQNRTLAMPNMPDEHAGHIAYDFYGMGGQYVVALNEGSWGNLINQGDTPSTWIIDTSNLDSDHMGFDGRNLHIGGIGWGCLKTPPIPSWS